MKAMAWKKTLSLMLVALVLVTGFGFTSAVFAEEKETDGSARAIGAGALTAEGDGIAIIGGRGVVELSGSGILWIKDVAGDATIRVSGHGEKEVFPDGWIQYAGFRGDAYVKGSRIRVIVAGTDINLTARGRGRALLWGHGTYEINGHSARWETERLGARVKIAATDVPVPTATE